MNTKEWYAAWQLSNNIVLFGFWKASIMKDPNKIMQIKDRGAMGHFDRITTIKDLPADKIMIAYIKEAVQLNEKGIKLPAKTKTTQKEIVVPSDIIAALKKIPKPKKYLKLSPHHIKKNTSNGLQKPKPNPPASNASTPC